ncbi:hypothetical protein A3B35_00225 [Candidatus Kaiserbacteria bacterium RIFCSPLOWO2_01_FULL_54_24]|uniref:Uncharacterized protein n=1 Tax=Candidatus Kaiserbacteria bacterium RIFCSPLOWO2_01_FULL_54_24 TaxID=1798515 RepID=A0A1F6ETC5_9BACT|nr:MAG: hypothetical protein A3B35_00225 [Candidatus Kaiserbacteria bacterium RIFCSPLOWO2_01_FULL_54_24]
MTPSTSLTLGGFVQGLQANMMGLIGSLVAVLIILLIVRWFISKSLGEQGIEQGDANSTRRWANSIALIITIVVVVGFSWNAANYATNVIPRTGLDRSSINQDMDANVKR